MSVWDRECGRQARPIENWPRHVHARRAVQSLSSSNVLSNRHKMSDFEGLVLDDVELLTEP